MSATALRLKGTKPVRQRGHFRQQSKRGNAESRDNQDENAPLLG
jgi:hypothetical protein